MRLARQVRYKLRSVFGVALLTCLAPAAYATSVLTSVRQIRELRSAEAAQGRPVVLTGTVTVLSGWKSSFFVQGPDFGISVDREDSSPQVESGDVVRISGVTAPGKFAPVLISKSITILGKGKLPAPRLYSAAELTRGREDAQRVAVRGIIRSAEVLPHWGHPVLFLKIDMGNGELITALVRSFAPADFSLLAGADVVVDGVCGTIFNDRRQFIGLRLFVASLGDVHVKTPARKTAFDPPATPISALLQFDPHPGTVRPIKLSGVVTLAVEGKGVYLQDSTGGAFIQTRASLPPVGARLEASGYPAVGQYSPKLEDALIRSVGSASLPAPVTQEAGRMIVVNEGFSSAPLDAMLVRVSGKLVEKVPKADETLLLLQQDTTLFSAHLPRTSGTPDAVAVGSVVSLTGICVVNEDEFHETNSFDVLMRGPADLTVLRGPPWWTAAHAGWVVALLVCVIAATFAWSSLTRRQHRLQELAVTDPLTELLNRRGFLLLAQQQWQLAQRREGSFLLFYIDVNDFKTINDGCGHQEGDLALRFVAKALKDTFRNADILGRLGGDEFAVAAIDATEESAGFLKSRIAAALRQYNQDGHTFRALTLSIGVLACNSSLGPMAIEDLLTRADSLMYEEKRQQKSRQGPPPGHLTRALSEHP